ncbi:endoplasmic reticulum vesicle transporter-domain-containing protein, partial [Protomyces lactucae-debilis]
LKAFDAFPKVESSYRAERTVRGAVLTVVLLLALFYLFVAEFTWYLGGYEHHSFSVEQEIKEHLYVNADLTVAMPCDMVTINVQDASGDRILAADALRKVKVDWDEDKTQHLDQARQEESHEAYDLQNAMSAARSHPWRRVRERKDGKACRLYGTMQVNHVAGDLHITAEGIGYMSNRRVAFEELNFTHRIDELSFGPYYPKLKNPLDGTHADAAHAFHRFQYFVNIVPTTYESRGRRIETNQYAVTESSLSTAESIGDFFPGIFIKYEIEPVSLMIRDARMPFRKFLVRLLGVLSGIVVSTEMVHRLLGDILRRV